MVRAVDADAGAVVDDGGHRIEVALGQTGQLETVAPAENFTPLGNCGHCWKIVALSENFTPLKNGGHCWKIMALSENITPLEKCGHRSSPSNLMKNCGH